MLKLAIKAAKEAGKIQMRHFKKGLKIHPKGKKDFYTNVDTQCQRKTISLIKSKHPHHSFLAEEDFEINNGTDYRWIIDPLDGTHNYRYGLSSFGVSIALEYKGEIVIGVIYLPYFDHLYYAEKGKGAFKNGKRIHVSKRDIKDALLMMGTTTDKKGFTLKMFWRVCKLHKKINRVEITGCCTMNLCLVASGNADINLVHYTSPWDFCAGALIVEEAGGVVTDWKGKRWSSESKQFIATNGSMHREVLKIYK